MRKLILTAACLATIVSCSDHKEPSKDTPQVDSVISQSQQEALNKARGVEDTLLQAEEQRRKEMDAKQD